MALLETEEIDDITFEDGGATCVLWLVDDFDWNSSNERYSYFFRGLENAMVHDFVHMTYLADKIHTYWISISEGYVLDKQVEPAPERFVIRVASIFPPNERGVWFLPLLHYACRWRGVGFEHEVCEEEEALAFRADDEAARSVHKARLKQSDHGTDGSDAGSEDRELRAQRAVFESDFPPHLWRWCGPYASEDDEGSRTGYPYSMETADVRKIRVTLNPQEVEMVIEDDDEWNDGDVFDPNEIAIWTDELIGRHDYTHMNNLWTRVRAILYLWRWKRVPQLDKKFYRSKLILKLVATHPPNDRGKWFLDWLRLIMGIHGFGFFLELSATEEAHELRQEAQQQRAVRASVGCHKQD